MIKKKKRIGLFGFALGYEANSGPNRLPQVIQENAYEETGDVKAL
jgi:hypothetical protein